jgi:hypothetical protein
LKPLKALRSQEHESDHDGKRHEDGPLGKVHVLDAINNPFPKPARIAGYEMNDMVHEYPPGSSMHGRP